jgi:hypothetical protein
MLLYQLTQWMEERSNLQQAMRQGTENSPFLQNKLEQIELHLQNQANSWRESIQDVSYLQIPFEAPHLDEDPVL